MATLAPKRRRLGKAARAFIADARANGVLIVALAGLGRPRCTARTTRGKACQRAASLYEAATLRGYCYRHAREAFRDALGRPFGFNAD